MHIYCEMLPLPAVEVVTVNLYTKEKTFELFNSLPDDVRFISMRVDCDGKMKRVRVALAEIVVKPVNGDGEIVSVDDAEKLKVSYFDRDGNPLRSDSIRLVPSYYPVRSTKGRARSE